MEETNKMHFGTYLAAALAMTAIFYAAAVLKGGYSASDIRLGAVWVFALSAIISASVLPRFFGKK